MLRRVLTYRRYTTKSSLLEMEQYDTTSIFALRENPEKSYSDDIILI